VYLGCDDIPLVRNGLGIAILSTPKGVMADAQAREARVGGEYLARVW
jgi:small subunit ribosomal protein S8